MANGARATNACVHTHWVMGEGGREEDLEIVLTYTTCNAPQYPYPPPSLLCLFLDGAKVNAPG
jgi:hypothetical protein